jgi:peptide/nickel transport system permease protein
MPAFILGIFLLLIFAVWLRTLTHGTFSFPLFGMHASGDESLPDLAFHLALPVMSLALLSIAQFSRYMRASLLDVLHQDYIRTARAKGLREQEVLWGHALRNSLIPLVTVAGVQVGYLLGGAVVTEEVFTLPGVGRLLLWGVFQRDYPLVQGTILFISSLFLVSNLVVDLIYAYVDPRIHYG